jgi:hypothetical protein
LYQILLSFNKYIFYLFSLNIVNYSTLTSLSFSIYRSKYLKSNNLIPLISGQTYFDIKKGYTVGATDVYKPFARNIKGYDVNSLYPSQMAKYDMPVGKVTFFEGNISKIDKNAFGFFQVEITTPDYMYAPIIQTRVKTKKGFSTIAPLGK